jgi:hypothetical protein
MMLQATVTPRTAERLQDHPPRGERRRLGGSTLTGAETFRAIWSTA